MEVAKKAKKPEYFLENFDDEDNIYYQKHTVPEMSLSETIESIGIGRFHYVLLFVLSWNFLNTSFQYILPGLLLPTFFKEFELGSFEISIYGFSEYLGYLTGSILSYMLSEKFGRRRAILVTLIISAILTAISSLAQSFFVIIVLRFIIINLLVINYYYSYSFMLELIPQKNKGNLMVYVQITNCLGIVLCILLVNCVFESLDYGNWQLLMIISSVLIWIAFTLNAAILDESPYYNMKKGNLEAAYLVLNRMAKFNLKNPDYLNSEKKRMISNWFIKNESNFILTKKKNEESLYENKWPATFILIWMIDLFVFHGFDFILPLFLVLRTNSLLQKNELLSHLLVMHLFSCCYVFLNCFITIINYKRKFFVIVLLICQIAVSVFMGGNLDPSFFVWMVVFKILINVYGFIKLQIVWEGEQEVKREIKHGFSLKIVKFFGKMGMICSTFFLIFFMNIYIYGVYFIFAGLFLCEIVLWTSLKDNFVIKEEDEKKETSQPLNGVENQGYDKIFRIIEIPL